MDSAHHKPSEIYSLVSGSECWLNFVGLVPLNTKDTIIVKTQTNKLILVINPNFAWTEKQILV